jgi:hypothetical protein
MSRVVKAALAAVLAASFTIGAAAIPAGAASAAHTTVTSASDTGWD